MTNLKKKKHPKIIRTGPRPLPLYLALAPMLWLNSAAALAILKNASALSNRSKYLAPRVEKLQKRLRPILEGLTDIDSRAEEKLLARLEAKNHQLYDAFLKGVVRYRHAQTQRSLKTPPILWQSGTTRLLDYGGKGPVALIIPSLINRYHVLDLDDQQSFARAMMARGFRVLMLDWGAPGEKEKQFTLDDYVLQRLVPALALAQQLQKSSVHVIGYCMGGLLAAALATYKPEHVRSLVFLATPWDFHAGDALLAARVRSLLPQLDIQLDGWGELPTDMLQCFFINLAPFAVLDKFVRFATMAENSAAARAFVLVEDWVNEGVPLVKNVARACLHDWYGLNTPARGAWQVSGLPVRAGNLAQPSLHIIPAHDKIVPPESALALAGAMPNAKLIQPDCGHISMMIHAAARDKLWPQIFDWLASQDTKP